MSEHEERLHRTLADLRAARGPSPRAETELLAKLEARLGGPPDGSSSGDGASGGGSPGGDVGLASDPGVTLGWAAKLVGATLGLTAAGLLALRVGVLVLSPAADEEPSEQAAIVQHERVAERGAEPAKREPAVEPVQALELVAAPPQVRASPHLETPARTSASESSDRLAAELALLQAAKTAKSASERLELLDRHAEQFPAGALASEREALAVVALCELDRIAAARPRALALALAHPGSPLLDRMREGCPTLAAEIVDDPQ